jgi:hypothetical protein
MNELLQALHDLPPVEAPVRWPDGPDLPAEVMANALLASPVGGRQYVEALRLCLDRSDTISDLVAELYTAGAYFGAHGGEECAALLWSLADAITASLDQEVDRA